MASDAPCLLAFDHNKLSGLRPRRRRRRGGDYPRTPSDGQTDDIGQRTGVGRSGTMACQCEISIAPILESPRTGGNLARLGSVKRADVMVSACATGCHNADSPAKQRQRPRGDQSRTHTRPPRRPRPVGIKSAFGHFSRAAVQASCDLNGHVRREFEQDRLVAESSIFLSDIVFAANFSNPGRSYHVNMAGGARRKHRRNPLRLPGMLCRVALSIYASSLWRLRQRAVPMCSTVGDLGPSKAAYFQ